MPLQYIDRKTGDVRQETVAGDNLLKWLYESNSGLFFLELFVKRSFFSKLYGKLQDSVFSKRKINRYIGALQIDLSEAKIENSQSYKTFNHFFTRELKPEARPIAEDKNIFVSPADGRISAWENIDPDALVQVKGINYTLENLLQNKNLAMKYDKGVCLVIRLNPADYHRFHFPDYGIPSRSEPITGLYYSVSPRALKKVPGILCENKRELTVFHSENFGDIVLVEVGATCVGSIIQTYTPEQPVVKGFEKGYFKFGGSTVLVFIKPGYLRIDRDLLFNTAQGLETKIYMGEKVGET